MEQGEVQIFYNLVALYDYCIRCYSIDGHAHFRQIVWKFFSDWPLFRMVGRYACDFCCIAHCIQFNYIDMGWFCMFFAQ